MCVSDLQKRLFRDLCITIARAIGKVESALIRSCRDDHGASAVVTVVLLVKGVYPVNLFELLDLKSAHFVGTSRMVETLDF
jgi:hypothetical protein